MPERSEVPEGWEYANLGTVAELISGSGFPLEYQEKTGQKYPFYKVGNLGEVKSGQYLTESKHTISEDTASELRAKIIPKDSIVFAKIGMAIALNRRRLIGVPSCIDNNMMAAVPNTSILSQYLLRFLETIDFMQYSQATTVPSLRRTDLAEIKVPLPPLAEQHRIVAAIEALFARLDAANARLERVPGILKQFRQAVLAAACDGRLTEDWRKEHPGAEDASRLLYQIRNTHELGGKGHGGKAAPPTDGIHLLDQSNFPEPWTVSSLNWLCMPGRPITYGILKPGPDQVNGIPYIRVADFPNDKILVEGVRRTTKEIADNYKRSALIGGDVLLSIRGTVGRVCRVPSELEGANVTQDTARISVHELLYADYVEIYLRCPSVKKILDRCTKGVAIRGVNIGDVRALQVAIPPLPEQHEIVRRVDALFALADRIEAEVAAARAKTGTMRQSILAQAFSGRLVPTEAELARREGRVYEPASVLLERIRSGERAKKAGKESQSTLT